MTNQISVRELELSPGEVRSAIEAALKRRASHQAAHIDITVDGGSGSGKVLQVTPLLSP